MAKATKRMKGVSCVTRKGEVYWYAHVNGRKLYFGKGDKGRKAAEAAKGKELATALESRQIRGGLDIKKWKITSFQELHKWYFELPDIENQKSYERKLNALGHLVAYFKNRPLNAFEADQQSLFRAHRKREGAADGTVNFEIEVLSAMFHGARRNKLIPPSVVPGTFKKTGNIPPRRGVTEDEFQRLLSAANGNFADFLLCGYETAMRVNEIRTLKVGQVKLGVQHISGDVLDYISLSPFGTKTKTLRIIPVSAALKPILEKRTQGKAPDDYVFTNSSARPYSNVAAISELMRYACRKASVAYGDKIEKDGQRQGITFHSLRHARITAWITQGFSDEIIRRASGHHSLDAYRAYVDIRDPHPIMNLVRLQKKTDNSGTKEKFGVLNKKLIV